MTKRVLLAGVLGGMAMFAGSSIAHMVLPPGEVGIKEISKQVVLSAMPHRSAWRLDCTYFLEWGCRQLQPMLRSEERCIKCMQQWSISTPQESPAPKSGA